MVDSPQRPTSLPEKPIEAVVVTDPLERLRRKLPPPPPEFPTTMLLIFLVGCGTLASAVLFLTGVDCTISGRSSEVIHQGLYFIGLAFFVGPLLFGIAGIVHGLNQRKRD